MVNSIKKYIRTQNHFSTLLFYCLVINLALICPAYSDVNDIAESYVKLVLKVGLYDPEYADSYFGPPEWKYSEEEMEKALDEDFPTERLMSQVDKLIEELDNAATRDAFSASELPRYNFLKKQLASVKCKIALLGYQEMSFDEETKALYDIVLPPFDKERYEKKLKQMDELLPGEGTLNERFDNFNEKFLVPSNKIKEILTTAINEYRKQTLEYINLPDDENLKIKAVGFQQWAASLQFEGDSSSVMELNTSNPFMFWDIIVLAKHECYPGHHTHLTMLEKHLYKQKGWIEFSILPLNSPLSLIAEGIAEYGSNDLMRKDIEKMDFERNTLFPMTGFNSSEANKYFKIMQLKYELNGAIAEAARLYLNDDLSYRKTHEFLEKYSLSSFGEADAYLSFIQHYRSYMVTYATGQELIRNYINQLIGSENNINKKWEMFNKLISEPITPSDLIIHKK